MSRGYRFIIFAAVGWLALCGAKLSVEQPKSVVSTESSSSLTNSATSPARSPSTKAGHEFVAYPGYNPDPCYNAQEHDAADLCAQWRAAIAAEKAAHEARRATTWSIVAAILNTIGLFAVGYALYLNIEANRIARLAAIHDRRPFLSYNELKVNWADGRFHGIGVGWINTGRSLAKGVDASLQLKVRPADEGVPSFEPSKVPANLVNLGIGREGVVSASLSEAAVHAAINGSVKIWLYSRASYTDVSDSGQWFTEIAGALMPTTGLQALAQGEAEFFILPSGIQNNAT